MECIVVFLMDCSADQIKGLFHFNLICTAIHKKNHNALHAIEKH